MANPINMLIARGPTVDIGQAYLDAQANSRANAQTQMAQQRFQQQQENDAEWESAVKAGDLETMYRLDPQAAQILQQHWQEQRGQGLQVPTITARPMEVPNVPGPITPTSKGGYSWVQQDGKVIPGSMQAPQRAPLVSAKATDTQGNAVDMSPEGLDLAAETYRNTGKLPTGLFRVPGAVVRVINRASELSSAAGEDAKATMLRQQSFNAQKTALAQVVKQKNMVGAFEKTAQRNMELAHQLSAKVDRSGVPLLNKAIMHFKQNVTGDPDTAAFVNALIAARTEYAKVLSGATGAQGITDSARREAEDLFSKATSPAQLDAVMQTATAEMANRMAAFDDQIAEMQRSSSPTPAPQKPPASTAPQITATDAKGNKVVLINGQWIPLRGN